MLLAILKILKKIKEHCKIFEYFSDFTENNSTTIFCAASKTENLISLLVYVFYGVTLKLKNCAVSKLSRRFAFLAKKCGLTKILLCHLLEATVNYRRLLSRVYEMDWKMQ